MCDLKVRIGVSCYEAVSVPSVSEQTKNKKKGANEVSYRCLSSSIPPDNPSCVKSEEVHYYCRRVFVLLHHNQYSSIKVMNSPFPSPLQSRQTPLDPLIHISQCGQGGTTASQRGALRGSLTVEARPALSTLTIYS